MAYDLSADLKRAASLIATSIEDFAHIDVSRVLFALTKAKAAGKHGLYATCQPLRFEGGESEFLQDGDEWIWPPIVVGGQEMLYALTAYIPRFLEVDAAEKIEVLVHELFHISPYFNGDIRRLGRGKNAAHGRSRAFFDRLISPYVKQAVGFLSPEDFPFIGMNYAKLSERFDGIIGQRYKGLRPRRKVLG